MKSGYARSRRSGLARWWAVGPVMAVVAAVAGATAVTAACGSPAPPPPGLGQECNFDAECAKVAGREIVCICTPDGGLHPQCTARLEAGDDCTRRVASYGVPCASGLGCAEAAGGTRRCMATLASGADCSNGPCAEGLFCDAKVCVPSRGTGEACVAGDPASCVAGALCGAEGVCVTALQPGAACTSSTQCSEGRCIPLNDSGTGVCAYPAPIGAVRYCQR